MANTVNVTIRMDSEVKAQAEVLFNELGMNMSTAFNIFVRQCLHEDAIPFQISRTPNKETIAAIEDAIHGRNLSGPYNSIESLWEALDAED